MDQDLQIKQKQKRISDLRKVISWSFENGGLSSGQRICLNQEIAGIMAQIDSLKVSNEPFDTYRIPKALEEKVQHFLGVIVNSGWQKNEVKY